MIPWFLSSALADWRNIFGCRLLSGRDHPPPHLHHTNAPTLLSKPPAGAPGNNSVTRRSLFSVSRSEGCGAPLSVNLRMNSDPGEKRGGANSAARAFNLRVIAGQRERERERESLLACLLARSLEVTVPLARDDAQCASGGRRRRPPRGVRLHLLPPLSPTLLVVDETPHVFR